MRTDWANFFGGLGFTAIGAITGALWAPVLAVGAGVGAVIGAVAFVGALVSDSIDAANVSEE